MSILKIRDPSLNLLAEIEEYYDDVIHESINREFTFSFTAIMDGEKSDYLIEDNIVEVEDNYFVILYVRQSRNQDNTLTVEVECDQVAIALNDPSLVREYFTFDGTPAALIAEALSGTGFTVGTVEPTDVVTFSIQEPNTPLGILVQFAATFGVELKYSKYSVSLLNRRGAVTGTEFRYAKNLRGITRHRDKRSGTLEIAFDIDVLELRTLPGYGDVEAYELGDTVNVIDEGLGANEELRIIEYDYSPRLRINSKVVIANYIEGIEDTITRIQRSTVVKDRLYNGIRIGPQNGYEAIRSDNKARAIMNATDGIRLQKGDGSGSNWEDILYFDIDEQEYIFVGKITAGIIEGSQIIGSTIDVGSNFSVDEEGIMTAAGANISGAITLGAGSSISWPDVNSDPATTTALNDAASAQAMAEAIANGTYSGGTFIDNDEIFSPNVSGGIITGALIQTSVSGLPRIELSSSSNILTAYASSDKSIEIDAFDSSGFPALIYRDGADATFIIQDGGSYDIFSTGDVRIQAPLGFYVNGINLPDEVDSVQSQANVNSVDISNLQSRMNGAEDDINDLQSDVNDKITAGTGGSETIDYINASSTGLVVWFTDGSNATILYD